jgi:myosin heavy subunit
LVSKAAAMSKPETASIGVETDECLKDNVLVREGIIIELNKRNVNDASNQTEKTNTSAATHHNENGINIQQRLMDIERECEERLRREFNAKLRLQAKQQAMHFERKHKDECRFLQKQLAEVSSRSKHREQELLQAISKQRLSGQKELKEVEQQLERQRLEKSTLESEMVLLNDRMKEIQLSRFNENESIEEHKRMCQIEVAEAVRERDRFQLMLASKSELLVHKTKELEQTQEELLKKLAKTESALNAKNSEATALRALLKQCQSALESLSYKDERCFEQKTAPAQLAPTIQPTSQQEQQRSLAAEELWNKHVKEEQKKPEETTVTPCNEHFAKKHLGDPPPYTSLGDPPEQMLALAQPLVQRSKEDRFSVEAHIPNEIELDAFSNCSGKSIEESLSLLPMHEEQVSLEDRGQSIPVTNGPESADNDKIQPESDKGTMSALETFDVKLLPEGHSNDEADATQEDENSSADRANESNEVNTDSSSDTDEYSMGSFCSSSVQKLDKQGRVPYIHIK